MSLTLCGETLTFAHDETLLGFCLDSTDEPVGESFEEICANKNNARHYGHVWFDPREGFATAQDLVMPQDEADVAADEDGYVQDDEVRSAYARFCVMSKDEQNKEVDRLKHLAAAAIYVDHEEFKERTMFVLDCIQCGMSDREFVAEVRACYTSRFGRVRRIVLTAEDRALVAKVAKMDDNYALREVDEGESRMCQQSTRDYGIARRIELGTSDDRTDHSIRSCATKRSHHTKPSRRSNRRETIRRDESKLFEGWCEEHDRNFAQFEAAVYEEEVASSEFLSVCEQVMMREFDDVEQLHSEWAMESMVHWFGFPVDRYDYPIVPRDVEFTAENVRCGKWYDRITHMMPSRSYSGQYLGTSSDGHEDHDEPMSLSEALAMKYGKPEDDIFAGFGEADADIDRYTYFGQGSQERVAA